MLKKTQKALFVLGEKVVTGSAPFGETFQMGGGLHLLVSRLRGRLTIDINGQFPGPTVRAKAEDMIVVEVKNSLPTEGVSIHWHGIRQLGTPWFDGTVSITQCPISPDESFVYRFKVDKAGTYFYHGHYGMQKAAGLYGSLIADAAEGEKEPIRYDSELSLLLSNWWHTSVHDIIGSIGQYLGMKL